MPVTPRTYLVHLLVALALGLPAGCSKRVGESALVVPAPRRSVDATSAFTPRAVGAPIAGKPWLLSLLSVDLDRDGLLDAVACDAQSNQVTWLRQTTPGVFEERVLASELAAPVHVSAGDVDGDGDEDLLVACMGQVFPNNDKIGSLVALINEGHQQYSQRMILDHTERIADARIGDFNRDGKPDIALAQFGYNQGAVRWLENTGSGAYVVHSLLELSGAINVVVADFDGNGFLDIAAIVSQEWERVVLFCNSGGGTFASQILFASSNEDFGSSNLSLADLNRDGRPDLLFTNGDGFDLASPGPRPWHGVQWLENVGQGQFRFHRIGDLPGAYCPIGYDVDGDGAMDVVAVGTYADWAKSEAISLAWFRNDGAMNFTRHVLAHQPTHLVTVAVGAYGVAGRTALLTGAFHAYPPFERLSRLTLWESVAP